jgi:hypothetical protein
VVALGVEHLDARPSIELARASTPIGELELQAGLIHRLKAAHDVKREFRSVAAVGV